MDGGIFAKYLLVMAGATYLIRAVPFLLFRRRIENQFALSVLYYTPYAVLGAMTFPDFLFSTGAPASAAVGLAVSFAAAYRNLPMVVVAVLGSAAAILVEWGMG